ncbi:MAG: hypothetical protein SGILL_000883 [Bacillariaceae sp.]
MSTVTVHHSNVTVDDATVTSPSSPFITEPSNVSIAGGGIVGLVLALALIQQGVCDNNSSEASENNKSTIIHVFEQAPEFQDDVGAGMGLYPNGLRVIRDISPKLLEQLQQAGCPYQSRTWMRHDGTQVASADETVLARMSKFDDIDPDLQPIGIRRWKLQKILLEAAVEAGVEIHFGKRLQTIKESSDSVVQMRFEDGSTHETKLLLAADGAKSMVRSIVTGGACELKYTGTTCLMGTSATPRSDQGLMLPSSPTTKCHGAFYPTSQEEQCFQFHFPTCTEKLDKATSTVAVGGWGGMTQTMTHAECQELATQLYDQGWDEERFVQPLQNVQKALRIGLTTLDPPLEKFTFDRIVLVGDAAHPPVPFLGQGAQQGLEDAGTLALLLKQFCVTDNSEFSLDHVQHALQIYNELRVPRTHDVVERGKLAGQQQQKRAENAKYNRVREEKIKREVFYNENSSHLFPGVRHDYKQAVDAALIEYRQHCVAEEKIREQKEHRLICVPEED